MPAILTNASQTLFILMLYCLICVTSPLKFSYVSQETPGYLCEGSLSSFHLQCEVLNISMNEEIYWYRENLQEELTAIYRDGEILTDGLALEEQKAYSHGSHPNEIEIFTHIGSGRFLHLNNYTCVVLDNNGETLLRSSGVIINVFYPPDLPQCIIEPPKPSLGNNVSLTCSTTGTGNPAVEFQWTTDNQTLNKYTGIYTTNAIFLNYSFVLQKNDYGKQFTCETKWKNCDDRITQPRHCIIKINDDEGETDNSNVLLIIIIGMIVFTVLVFVIILFIIFKLKAKRASNNTTDDPPMQTQKNLKDESTINEETTYQEYLCEESKYCTVQNTENEQNLTVLYSTTSEQE